MGELQRGHYGNVTADSSLDKERRKGSVESHTLAARVEEVSNPRVELAWIP